MKMTISIAVILLINVILAACTGGVTQSEYSDLQNQLAELQDQLQESQQTSQPTIAPTPTPTLAPTPVPTPSPSLSPSPTGKTEQRFGYISDAYSSYNVNYIKINYIAYFTGDAAYDDSYNNPDIFYHRNTYYDGDYYARDQSAKLRTWPLSPDFIVTYIGNESTHGFNPGRLIQERVVWRVSVHNRVVVSILEVFTVPYYNFR